jgi:hypothetical protein
VKGYGRATAVKLMESRTEGCERAGRSGGFVVDGLAARLSNNKGSRRVEVGDEVSPEQAWW